jgi:hypothetical protein
MWAAEMARNLDLETVDGRLFHGHIITPPAL